MEDVLTRLYIGGDKDYLRIKDNDGWSFLRACKEGPGGHRDLVGYHSLGAPKGPDYLWFRKGNTLALNLIDADDPAFVQTELIKHGCEFVTERLKAGDKVLVACNHGHSRGPIATLLYMRSIGEMPHNFIKSERILRTLYPDYDPGIGLRQFARSHWYEFGREHGV